MMDAIGAIVIIVVSILIITFNPWRRDDKSEKAANPPDSRPGVPPPASLPPREITIHIHIEKQRPPPAGASFDDIRSAVDDGDFDYARMALQRIAYGSPSWNAQQKDEFTSIMKSFCAVDPLFKAVTAKLLPLIEMQPGIKQTALYPMFPDLDVETVRYVAYFADQMNLLERRKKGNTYTLHAIGPVVADVPKLES